MANEKTYGVLGLFALGFILFMVMIGGHVTAKLKHHKEEIECVQDMISHGHPRSIIQFKDGVCGIKPLS